MTDIFCISFSPMSTNCEYIHVYHEILPWFVENGLITRALLFQNSMLILWSSVVRPNQAKFIQKVYIEFEFQLSCWPVWCKFDAVKISLKQLLSSSISIYLAKLLIMLIAKLSIIWLFCSERHIFSCNIIHSHASEDGLQLLNENIVSRSSRNVLHDEDFLKHARKYRGMYGKSTK
jgi:hypothetical protein